MRFIIFLALIFSVQSTFGQRLNTPTLSPACKIVQEVALTEVTIEYARPSAKGRKVFGDLVPYGKIWRTGANASTKMTFSEDVKLGGNELSAGTYALYSIPGEREWTIIVHSNTKMRSIEGRYDEKDDVFRFVVPSESVAEAVESLTIHFTDIATSSCNIQLTWENTKVNIPVDFEVDAQIEKQMVEFMKSPETIPHRTYFEAAQYYLHNDKDLEQALAWINNAMDKSEMNPRYGLLKAKIEHKKGDMAAATKTIKAAYTWAEDKNNNNYMGQTKLFMQELGIN